MLRTILNQEKKKTQKKIWKRTKLCFDHLINSVNLMSQIQVRSLIFSTITIMHTQLKIEPIQEILHFSAFAPHSVGVVII